MCESVPACKCVSRACLVPTKVMIHSFPASWATDSCELPVVVPGIEPRFPARTDAPTCEPSLSMSLWICFVEIRIQMRATAFGRLPISWIWLIIFSHYYFIYSPICLISCGQAVKPRDLVKLVHARSFRVGLCISSCVTAGCMWFVVIPLSVLLRLIRDAADWNG